MRNFIVFLSLVFLGLFLGVLNKTEIKTITVSKPTLTVFGYSSFTGRWGPGPYLKDQFEKTCNCKIEFIESTDSGYLLQRLKFEGERHGADMVIGLDQFDLPKALQQTKWRPLTLGDVPVHESVRSFDTKGQFLPYDMGVLAFIIRKGDFKIYPTSLDDLLKPEFSKQIAIENPSTSSPGLQFINWVFRIKGTDEGTVYLEKFLKQTHSVTPGWTEAYGLFKKKIVSTTLSYTTSPLYHLIEEKNDSYIALEFKEGHPIQIEFMGIPETCKNCELAEKFASYILSTEGQKIIMERNYMIPVRLDAIPQNSPFAKIPPFKILDILITTSPNDLESHLQRWSILRRGDK